MLYVLENQFMFRTHIPRTFIHCMGMATCETKKFFCASAQPHTQTENCIQTPLDKQLIPGI